MKLTVNDKGSIGVSKVISCCLEEGFYVFLPFDGSSPVDLIVANKDMSLKRLQVKWRIIERKRIRVPLSSVVNGKRIPVDLSKIDGWAIYCPDTNKIYFVSNENIKGTWIVIKPDDDKVIDELWRVKPTGVGSCLLSIL